MGGPGLNPGDRAVRWIGNLTLTDDYAGRPFDLRPWQADGIIRPLFGTIRPDGLRQYRRCFLFIPRKQGKTEIAAAIGCYCLLGEKKEGQEIVCAASDRDQAGKLYEKALSMIEADPYLLDKVRVYSSKKRIVTRRGGNTLQVVSSEGRRQHGGNPSVLLFDELHTQPDRRLYDALTSGQATRRERLILLITTAGNSKHTLCGEEYGYATRVRDGLLDDPTYLPIIFEAPREADWTSEATWAKAMPALGDFADIEYFRDEMRKAKEIPSEESKFRQYFLNEWVAAATKWLNRARWEECGRHAHDPDELIGRECYSGLDLSSISDITAFVMVFPMEDGSFRVVCHFWIPREYAEKRDATGQTTYLRWAKMGLITLTDGDVIDYDAIFDRIVGRPAEDGKDEIVGLAEQYAIKGIFADPWNATQLILKLIARGLPVVTMRQGTFSMNAPVKFLEVLIAKGLIHHGNNAVLNWMADNAVAVRDGEDNVKLSKEKSAGKIDGMVALVMGLAGAMSDGHEPAPGIQVISLG